MLRQNEEWRSFIYFFIHQMFQHTVLADFAILIFWKITLLILCLTNCFCPRYSWVKVLKNYFEICQFIYQLLVACSANRICLQDNRRELLSGFLATFTVQVINVLPLSCYFSEIQAAQFVCFKMLSDLYNEIIGCTWSYLIHDFLVFENKNQRAISYAPRMAGYCNVEIKVQRSSAVKLMI